MPVFREYVKVEMDNYRGVFFYADRRGCWRKFDTIGNAGVAGDVVAMLRKLGHTVDVVDITPQEEGD